MVCWMKSTTFSTSKMKIENLLTQREIAQSSIDWFLSSSACSISCCSKRLVVQGVGEAFGALPFAFDMNLAQRTDFSQ